MDFGHDFWTFIFTWFHVLSGFMWIGLIMAFNVWFIIWPNQQKVLGLKEASADDKKSAARKALLASRTNTMLSIPMLFAMIGMNHLPWWY